MFATHVNVMWWDNAPLETASKSVQEMNLFLFFMGICLLKNLVKKEQQNYPTTSHNRSHSCLLDCVEHSVPLPRVGDTAPTCVWLSAGWRQHQRHLRAGNSCSAVSQDDLIICAVFSIGSFRATSCCLRNMKITFYSVFCAKCKG